jgi:hypothetical protein
VCSDFWDYQYIKLFIIFFDYTDTEAPQENQEDNISSSGSSSSDSSDDKSSSSDTDDDDTSKAKDADNDDKRSVGTKDSESDSSSSDSNGSSSDHDNFQSKRNKSNVSSSDEESDTKSTKSTKSSKSSKRSSKSATSQKVIMEPQLTPPDPLTEVIEMEEEVNNKRTKRFTLPFFFTYIAWVVCIATIVASIFFLWGYAITFGNDKTYQWLTSILVAFFVGLLIFDPLKVALIACCISAACRRVDMDDDDVEDDELDPTLADQNEWYGDDNVNKAPSEPIDEVKLEYIRAKRQKELEMWSIIKELAGFFVFIMIVFIIAYLNRDPASYRFQDQLRYNFVTKNGFDKVKTSNDWWEWVHKTAVNELKATNLYNGQPPYGLRGFIGDLQSRIMGYGTLRQIRVKPNSCRVHKSVLNLTQECAQV